MLRIQSRCLLDDYFSSQAKSDFNAVTSACQARQSLTCETAFRLPRRPPLPGTKQPPPSSVKLWKEKRLSKALVLAGISIAVFQANGHYRELKRFVNTQRELFSTPPYRPHRADVPEEHNGGNYFFFGLAGSSPCGSILKCPRSSFWALNR